MNKSIIGDDGLKILIVSDGDPTDNVAMILSNISDNEMHNHEVYYLNGNIFSYD